MSHVWTQWSVEHSILQPRVLFFIVTLAPAFLAFLNDHLPVLHDTSLHCHSCTSLRFAFMNRLASQAFSIVWNSSAFGIRGRFQEAMRRVGGRTFHQMQSPRSRLRLFHWVLKNPVDETGLTELATKIHCGDVTWRARCRQQTRRNLLGSCLEEAKPSLKGSLGCCTGRVAQGGETRALVEA